MSAYRNHALSRCRRVVRFALPALAGALLLAGGPAGAQDAKLKKLTPFKMLMVPYFSPEQIAKDQGFFKKYNLDVELVKQVGHGVRGMQAMIAGHVPTGQGWGAPPTIQALAGGAKITTVLAGIISTDGDFRLYSLAGSGVTSAKDLIGKTVGIHNAGSYADYILAGFVKGAGQDLSKVRRLTVPLPSMCEALLTKQVDAVALYSLFYIACTRKNPGKLHLLAKDNDALPPSARLYSAYTFTTEYTEKNPDIVRAFVAGMKDAMAFIDKNPEAAKKIIAKRTGLPENLLLIPKFAKGGCIDAGAAADWIRILTDLGAIKAGSVKPAGWFTNRFNPGC